MTNKEALWSLIDPEQPERRVNATVGAPVMVIHHSQGYYVLRAAVRACFYTLIAAVMLLCATESLGAVQ